MAKRPTERSRADPSAPGTSGSQIDGTGMSATPKSEPSSAPSTKTTGPICVFYSYSHKDKALRDRLAKALALLKRQGLIAEWHDRGIGAGEEWKGAIDTNLRKADLILLLVSDSFIDSDYCWDVEVKLAIERQDRGDAKVIPVILRECDWQGAPFGKLQALPEDSRAVMSRSNKDKAWTDVAKGIRKAVEAIIATPLKQPSGVRKTTRAGARKGLQSVPAHAATESSDFREANRRPDSVDDERRIEIQGLIENEIKGLAEEDQKLLTKALAKALIPSGDPRLVHDADNLCKDIAVLLAVHQLENQFAECVDQYRDLKKKGKTAAAGALHEILKVILPLEIDRSLLDYVWDQVSHHKMVFIWVPVERHQTVETILSGVERKPASFDRKLTEIRSKALVCELPAPGKQSPRAMALEILKSLCEGNVLPGHVDDKLSVEARIELLMVELEGILKTFNRGDIKGRRPYCIVQRLASAADRAIFDAAIKAIDTDRLRLLFVELSKDVESPVREKEAYLFRLLNEWFDNG